MTSSQESERTVLRSFNSLLEHNLGVIRTSEEQIEEQLGNRIQKR